MRVSISGERYKTSKRKYVEERDPALLWGTPLLATPLARCNLFPLDFWAGSSHTTCVRGQWITTNGVWLWGSCFTCPSLSDTEQHLVSGFGEASRHQISVGHQMNVIPLTCWSCFGTGRSSQHGAWLFVVMGASTFLNYEQFGVRACLVGQQHNSFTGNM